MTDFVEIIRLDLKHEFYSSGKTPDFSVAPLASTRDAMKNLRLHFRQDGAVVRFFADAVGKKPVIDLAGLSSVSVGLLLKNTRFVTFTELPDRAAVTSQPIDKLWFKEQPSYCWSNLVGEQACREKNVIDMHEFVPVRVKASEPHKTVTVTLTNSAGIVVLREMLNAVPGKTEETKNNGWINGLLDARPLPKGLYQMTTDMVGQPDIDIFLRDGLGKPFLGTAILTFGPGGPVNAAGEIEGAKLFDIRFKAKKQIWSYHIKVGPKKKDKKFGIKHSAASGDAEILFDQAVEQPATAEGKKLMIQSSDVVALTEKPRAAIALLELPEPPPAGGQPATGHKEVIGNLPSPSPGEVNAEVFVQV